MLALLALTATVSTSTIVPIAAESKPASFAVAGPKGYGFESADGANSFYVHWLAMVDFQTFFGEKPIGVASRDSYVLRFAGMQLDAILFRFFHSQLLVDFSSSRLTLLDAWIQIELAKQLNIRVGKFPYPINEERLTPLLLLPFVNVSIASFLLPSRDIGVQIHGEVGPWLRYNAALVNGAFAGTMADADFDSDKDVVARIFVRPFATAEWTPIEKLGVGFGVSYGRHEGTMNDPQLPVLRTYGGQTFFAYRSGMARARGAVLRMVPHFTYGWGPIAGYGDYVHTIDHVEGTRIESRAWSVIGQVVLTGEEATPLRFINPARPLELDRGHFGAVTFALGVGAIFVGDAAFLRVADPAIAMQKTSVIGGSLNWYPVRGIALVMSYGHMMFRAFGEADDRREEDAFVARFEMLI